MIKKKTFAAIAALITYLMACPSAWADGATLSDAAAAAARKIGGALGEGTRVAVVGCASASERLSERAVRELTFAFVETDRLVVVDREDIDLVRDELNFQLSGDVSDETAQSIGKMLGAQAIVAASIDDAFTLRTKAIEVETARILAVSSTKLDGNDGIRSLLESVVLVTDCEANGADRKTADALTGIIVSAISSAPGFRAASEESRARAMAGKTLQAGSLSDGKTRRSIGAMADADAIMLSKVSLEGGMLFFTVTRVSVDAGTVIASSTETYRSPATLLEGARGQVLRNLGVQAANDDRKTITVANMTELIQAIGPDRVIRVAPGNYDLSEGYAVKNKYVSWVDEYDGPCPVVKSVSNLALVGDGVPTLMIKPAYGWVFSFDTCSGIKISGMVFGHTVPGYCLGGVLRFRNCDDVEIRSCELYGSGTYGIGLERATGFRMENCVVRDCTYGLATIERSSDVTFEATAFRGTGEFELITVNGSDHVTWTECAFERNWGHSLFSVDGLSRDVRTIRCSFRENQVDAFSSTEYGPGDEGSTFAGNAAFDSAPSGSAE